MKLKFSLMMSGAIVALCTLVSLTGCKDDEPDFPDNFAFKQQLRVEQYNDGTTNAFANFIALDGKGKEVSVKLPKVSSIKADNTTLLYSPAEEGETEYFAYSATLPGTPSQVTFTFHRLANLNIVNVVNLDKVPMIKLPMGNIIVNNKEYTFTTSVENPSARIRIFAMAVSGDNRGQQYEATLTGSNSYRFMGVPAGSYILRSMSVVSSNLQEQNFTAGGTIEACKVYQITGVTVE